MTNKIINTKHNALYKYFKKIATKKSFRKEKNKTILVGPHLINIFLQKQLQGLRLRMLKERRT
jgi:hypothetical protein